MRQEDCGFRIAALSLENQRFLESMVAAGEFPTITAVLDAAVSALQFEFQLRMTAEQGIADLDAGRYVEFDENGLKNYFQQLIDAKQNHNAMS